MVINRPYTLKSRKDLIISQKSKSGTFDLLSDFKAASALLKYINIHINERVNTAETLLLEHYVKPYEKHKDYCFPAWSKLCVNEVGNSQYFI